MAQNFEQPRPPSGPYPNPSASGNYGSAPGPSQGDQKRRGFMDFVMFRTMITPGLISIIWVIGFALITIGSIATIGSSDTVGIGLLAALLLWLVGNLYLRVILELMIVLFRIYSRLGDVERNTRPK